MKAFHGKEIIKKKYLDRVIHHQKMDHLVRGQGWSNGKGCAVGCTLENYDHSLYPIELGIPEWLARIEDTLFEGMNEEKSHTWPEVFLKAIPVGAELEKAKTSFIIVILEDAIKSMDAAKFDAEKFSEVAKAIAGSKATVFEMIEAQKSGEVLQIQVAAARAAAAAAAYDFYADELVKILKGIK